MKKLLALLLLCSMPVYGQGISSMLPGPGTVHSAGGGGYTGPGNTLAGNTEYWGLDAVTSAYRGSKAINLCNVSDVACADVNVDATTGLVPNAPVIGGSNCSVVACTIKIFYGQQGTSDFVQNTIGSRAAFVASCVGSLPCARAAGSACYATSANITVTAQPFTAMSVAKRTAAFTTEQVTIGADFSGGATWVIDFNNSADTMFIYAGSSVTAAATDSTMHTFQTVFNSTSSIVAVDATQSTLDPGSSGTGNAANFLMCDSSSARKLQGDFLAAGVWGNAGGTSGNLTTINTNYHSRWGY